MLTVKEVGTVAPATVSVPERPVETISPMKLSEAMRLGAMSTYQIIGTPFDELGGACAIGAVQIGLGLGNDPDRSYVSFYSAEPDWAKGTLFDCPVTEVYTFHGRKTEIACGSISSYSAGRSLSSITYHMNDCHQLPREWIADWLESMGM